MERKNISEIRNDYKLRQLDDHHVSMSPIKQLEIWLHEAIEAALNEPTAMTVSTISENNRPSSRIVLLKGITDTGLVFFTNYNSKKGQDLCKNPYAAINFFWPELERQVRVEGKIEKVLERESDAYFQSRPRGSQLGATVSPQSQVIESRDLLEKEKEALEKKYEGKEIPRPSHWGGYMLVPDYFEFWQGRQNRLHDRIIYSNNNGWNIKRLAP